MLSDIEAARRVIAAQVLRTPMLPAPKLSQLTGANVWVKYENLQVTNSFKERGAVVKLTATEAYGATVVLHGETVADAQVRAEEIAAERKLVWVHPYDNPHVIAGQGTVALEMLEEAPDIDVLVIPIGGGGLIAGN